MDLVKDKKMLVVEEEVELEAIELLVLGLHLYKHLHVICFYLQVLIQ